MRRLPASVFLVVCAASVAEAQLRPGPERPRDASIADSNDARAFLSYAQRMAEHDPDAASAAFDWAARLDPTSGDVLYWTRDDARHALAIDAAELVSRWAEHHEVEGAARTFSTRHGVVVPEGPESTACCSESWPRPPRTPGLGRRGRTG